MPHDTFSDRRPRALLRHLVALLALSGLGVTGNAQAGIGDCGQPLSVGTKPTAADALYILRVAVGLAGCERCTCDIDDSGSTTATDALKTLQAAVGLAVDFACPACTSVSLCDALVLGATSGEPFDTIAIGDVPDGVDSVWAIVTPTVGDAGIAGVLLADEGIDRLMVPTHPDGGVGGGMVAVTITDGSETCPVGSLEILPLPAAPATTSADTLAAFLSLIDAFAADFGWSGADLATMPMNSIPPALVPLALAQIVLNGPGNENSLAALLAGTAPDADGGIDTDLLNRSFAKIGLEGALQDLLASRLPLNRSVSVPFSRHRIVPPELGTCESLGQIYFEIADAEQLSTFMQEGLAGRDGQSSLGDQVIKDSLAMVFTVLGLGNVGVGAAGGAALFAWSKYHEMVGNLYPSILTKIRFDVENNGRIPEDRMDGGSGATPPLPEWSNPRLYATNLGMGLTRTTIEALITAANFIPIPGLVGAELLKAGSLEAANQALGALGEGDCWTIDPTTWGPIGEAQDPKYVEPIYFGTSVQKRAFESFEPVALGTTQLRLRTTDAFTGPSVNETKDIEVVTKRVSIRTPKINVAPGAPVEVIATVSDSYRPEAIDWEYPGFVVNPIKDPPAGNIHTLRFTSPTNRDLYPFKVRAYSTSLKLDPQTPEREAEAQITAEAGVTITPGGTCLGNDDPSAFTAVVTGLGSTEDDSVTWSLSGAGDLVPGDDNTAIYTAPSSGMGEATITATLNMDDTVKDEVLIAYGPCAINLDLGWYAGSSTWDPNIEPDVDRLVSAYYSGPLFPEDGDMLTPPDMWWNGESRIVSTSVGSTYLQPVYDDTGFMHELPLSSSSEIAAELTSSVGGGAAMSMSWTTSAECKPIPNSENGVECSHALAEFTWTPMVWIDVSEAGTYVAQFNLRCSGGAAEGLYVVGASTQLSRHVGGAAKRYGGVGASNDINPLNPFGAPTPPPNPIGASNFLCEPGTEILAFAEWKLNGPINPPERDIVVLSIVVTSKIMTPVDFFTNTEPAPVGSYEQHGTVSGLVSVVRVEP